MSTTPRTDEQVLAYRSEDGSEFVHASFAEELETELAAAIQISTKYENRYFENCAELAAMTARAEKAEADTARLDWLGKSSYAKFYEGPCVWRINGDEKTEGDTLRDSIDTAMKEASK
jgi:murein tripeptide amidase MpaA